MTVPGAAVSEPRAAGTDRRRPVKPAVSIILPTYNEAENLPLVLAGLARALAEFDYEIIVVDDDSPDLTWQVAETMAARQGRIRVVRRVDQRGLASAVLTGMSVATGKALVTMDADQQHDPEAIPAMLAALAGSEADVCVASRTVAGGSYGSFRRRRRALSRLGAVAARVVVGVDVTDPMSGFFAVTAGRYRAVASQLNPRGFKILLEVLAAGPRPKVVEVGYRFGARRHGTTKLSWSVLVSFALAVVELGLGRMVSARFTAFALAALAGTTLRRLVHMVASAIDRGSGGPPPLVTAVALTLAIVAMFVVNDRLTFADVATAGSHARSRLIRFTASAAHAMICASALDRWPGPLLGAWSAAAIAGAVLAPWYAVCATWVWPIVGRRRLAQ